jgi:uncharacterized OB-fold protein
VSARSAAGAQLDGLPADGRLRLQVCAECGCVQYPPRERCGECLGAELPVQVVDGSAELLAATALHHSLDAWFAARLPWTVASLRLAAGPVVFAHCPADLAEPGRRLRVANARGPDGHGCLVALAPTADDEAELERVRRALGMPA